MTLSIAIFYIALSMNGSPQAITHCRGSDGAMTFTDRSCPMDTESVGWQSEPLNVLTMESVVDISRKVTAKEGKKGKKATVNRMDREKACANARTELKALRADRRRGYRLVDAAKLDARLSQLKAEKRQFC